MAKIYEVWTFYDGKYGTDVFSGCKRDCNSYVKQAIKKGACPGSLVIVPCCSISSYYE